MMDLILCIICTGGIFLIFRFFKTMGINTPMAIVVNYAVAGGLGWTLAGGVDAMARAASATWFPTTAIMGVGFLFLFNMIAYCTRELGVATTSLSAKLSLIIPSAVFIITDSTDVLTTDKAIAFSLAIVAIILCSAGKRPNLTNKGILAIPGVIFLGSGSIDLIFGLFSDAEPLIFTSVPFTVAFLIGVVIRISPKFRYRLTAKDLLGGLVLGVVNFGSLYYLLGAFENSGLDKSAVVPSLNIGVITFSTIAAFLLFKEKPSARTSLGLTLGLISISIFLLFSPNL